jgi:hypothetical protein
MRIPVRFSSALAPLDERSLPQPTIDPAGAMQNLVYTMLDVFDATKDLHQTLTIKDQREYELRLRSKGYSSTKGLEFVRDGELTGEEAIMMDLRRVSGKLAHNLQ